MNKKETEPIGTDRTQVPIRNARIGTLPDRLRKAIKGESLRSFAQRAQVSVGTLRNILSGNAPRLDTIVQIADTAGVSAAWLATGEGPMRPRGPVSVSDDSNEWTEKLGDEYALIPLYDVRAAAGHGALVEDENIINWLAFRKDWLRNELKASVSDLYLIEVDGESMEPTLRPGDVILIDRREAQAVSKDGIYVLRMDDALLVKRIQRLPGRKVRVTSDNPAYEPFQLDLGSPPEEITIIGRVVWAGRRM